MKKKIVPIGENTGKEGHNSLVDHMRILDMSRNRISSTSKIYPWVTPQE